MTNTGRALRVILVDDDEEDREFFREAAEEVAPQIDLSLCMGGEALMNDLRQPGSELPDLIILDLNMPVKNGHECLDEIREDALLKGIPVIIYSTSSSRTQIDAAYLGGADLYIPKPERYNDLLLLLREVFSKDWATHDSPPREKFVLRAVNLNNGSTT